MDKCTTSRGCLGVASADQRCCVYAVKPLTAILQEMSSWLVVKPSGAIAVEYLLLRGLGVVVTGIGSGFLIYKVALLQSSRCFELPRLSLTLGY